MTWWRDSQVPEAVRVGFGYAEDVTNGNILAGHYTKLACQRSLDMARKGVDGSHFDLAAAQAIVDYIQRLKHIKGAWARNNQSIVLEPWQQWKLIVPFGWKRIDTGGRLIRTTYWEVARKNAKSTLAAGVGLYMMEADGEPSAEVYSVATTGDQSRICWSVARAMEMKTPHDGVRPMAHQIKVDDPLHPGYDSVFKPLHAEGSTMDGFSTHCAIQDELHAWSRRDVFEVIETSTGSRDQSLTWSVTTAGTNFEGVCYEQRGYLVQLLEGVLDDPTYWGNIWTIDKNDDWRDRSCWIKANPNLGVSVYELDMERLARKAENVTAQQSAFLNKRLNVWTNAAQAWMNMQFWDNCEDKTLKLEDFAGRVCFLGVDLGSKNDLTALVYLFPEERDGKMHVTQFVKCYLPEFAVENSDNAAVYDGWYRSGHIIATPGKVLDVNIIQDDVYAAAKMFDVPEIGFDPMHHATQFGVNVEAELGEIIVEVRPTVMNFCDPMKYIEALVRDGRWHHDGNPCLTWQISNTEVKMDMKSNIFPRKPQAGKAENRKIDAVVGTIIAANRLLANPDSRVFDRDLLVL